ncbi:MAG TPA: DNA topoisomerase I [Methanoregulaceae archaeon]|nr:DNA topoisomerase I [Methanoregulaceae archaeon]
MHLIVAEKNISAQRIAGILAGKEKVRVARDGGISSYHFDEKAVVGLRGHVVEVDFVKGYSNWRSEERPPRSLIDADMVKIPTERKIVNLIQKLAKKSDRVTIATDFDAEGELIAKEAYELIHAVNRKVNIDRARFSAITPEEITNAFARPTGIDFDLAAAGETRQVIDLMWGASLTRFISLAARRGGGNILSVGRVQSPTLAMIVDREKDIEAFVPEKYWQLSLETEKDTEIIEARHTTSRFTSQKEALTARDNTKEPLVVTEVKEGSKVDRAPTPFDTTAFIVAVARLGFPAARAMRLAEDLYMNGYISYPRTDNTVYPPSLNLSGLLQSLKKSEFREDVEWVMANRRKVPTRGKKSSTDHPPIHPASAASRQELGEERWKIYELVVRRFLATLSPDARWLTMKVNFDAGGEPYTATGGRLTEPGWRRVYPYSKVTEYMLPGMKAGERLPLNDVTLEEKETQPPPRYSQSKLIQKMEELGLGTKSTRHEVIQKLISRKYVEGTPLRPTLVGRSVIDSLENHADTITRPIMTQTLESHMQQIREKERGSDDVVTESREMLHTIFDQLEQHEQEIGAEIMEQTAEELTLGPCPVCGHDLRIRHMRGQTQFIGCTSYPDCGFNISLPMTAWGFAVRVGNVCEIHNLHHVRLVKKGARPWDLGCPLCHHIASNRETLKLIPSLSEAMMSRLIERHIYTVYELVHTPTEEISSVLGITPESARKLVDEAEDVLDLLRRRSDCRKFVRKYLPPRRGRSPASVIRKMHEVGINDVTDLSHTDEKILKTMGVGEKEASILLSEARKLSAERELREIGIPAVSLKKYQKAGIIGPSDFLDNPYVYISAISGVSPDTVYRHVEMVAKALNRPAGPKYSRTRVEKGNAGLLAIRGVGEAIVVRLSQAGIIEPSQLAESDPEKIARLSGIPAEKVREYQRTYRENENSTR